jgi:hypothetical protein
VTAREWRAAGENAARHSRRAITRAGWDLLRYTWHELDGRPAQNVAEIIESLAPATVRG